jgi:hypothetical protein
MPALDHGLGSVRAIAPATTGAQMAKRMTPKKRLKVFFAAMKAAPDKATVNEPLSERNEAKKIRRLSRKLANLIELLFKDAGWDIDNDDDWRRMLLVLAAVIFGGRGPGKPKKWSKKTLRRLRDDVAKIQAESPNLSQLKCCKMLIRRSAKKNYKGVENAETLRRQLQTSNRLDKGARRVVATGDKPVIPDVQTSLKKES